MGVTARRAASIRVKVLAAAAIKAESKPLSHYFAAREKTGRFRAASLPSGAPVEQTI